MSFIRLKKRITKTKTNFYAYLVENKWQKNSSKQKIKLYLGRYYKIHPKTNYPKTSLNVKKDKVFFSLLKKELLFYNFKQKKRHLFIHPEGFIINIKSNKVINNQTKKPVCLGLNQGYLCTYTLKNLFNFRIKPKNKKKTGEILIKLILDAGLNPDKELFLEIFNKIINIK